MRDGETDRAPATVDMKIALSGHDEGNLLPVLASDLLKELRPSARQPVPVIRIKARRKTIEAFERNLLAVFVLTVLGKNRVLAPPGFLVDANDLDEALSIAERIPMARKGTVEVRPVVELPGMPQ